MNEEYYALGQVEGFTSGVKPLTSQYEEKDESWLLARDCEDFVKLLIESFERNRIPFDQIQLRVGINLIIKKDAFDQLQNWINKSSNKITKEDIECYIMNFLLDDISEYIDLQIDGDCNETGTEEVSIKKYQNDLSEVLHIKDLSRRENSLVDIQYLAATYATMMLNNIQCGRVNLKEFIKSMKSHRFDIKFSDELVDVEHVKELLVKKFFENDGWFYMYMTYDCGRIVNNLRKKYVKQK